MSSFMCGVPIPRIAGVQSGYLRLLGCVGAVVTLTIILGCGAARVEAPVVGRTSDVAQVTTRRAWTGFIEDKPVTIAAGTMGDEATIARIIDEGVHRNEVMNHLRYLTKEIGPRLTGSTRAKRANEWTRDLFRTWGLTAELEQWGTVETVFDRGPSLGVLLMSESPRPRRRPGATGTERPAASTPEMRVVRTMEFTTLSWTRGTDGPRRGPVIRMPKTPEEFEKVKDSLKGAWVMIPQSSARGMRETRGRVSDMYTQRREAREKNETAAPTNEAEIRDRVALIDVAGYITTSGDERVWTGSIGGWRTTKLADIPNEVSVIVRLSDYDYMNSRLTDGGSVTAEFDLKHDLIAGPSPVFNTIAEIRGSDLPNEVVYVSAHMDSWDGPGSQGATDNGTGTAVTLEAARILMASGAKPRRTIRFALWTGEEQGLLGSEFHVKQRKSDWANWSACINDDGGTNTQGGMNSTSDEMAQMLAAATAPVNGLFFDSVDGKALNVNIKRVRSLRNDGGSDHASFNQVGVPGFFWDEVGRADYGYGWHTQHDKYELAIAEYLKQSATCSAITAYRLACAPTLLPREAPRDEDSDRGAAEPAGDPGAGKAARALSGAAAGS